MPHQFKHDAGMHRHPAMTITPIAHAARLALCSALLVGTSAFVPAMAQNTPDAAVRSEAARQYNIPAGSLDQVLGRFGREAGALVAIDPELTAGEQSSGLKGSYSVSGGLDAILGTHRLEAVPGANGGYRLRRVAPGISTLPAVTVSATLANELPAAYAGGQLARGGRLGLLGNTDIMDTPFNTTNYTAEILQNQQSRTLADVVINDPSVRVLTASGGFGDDFLIRGFAVPSGDVGLNGLFGLVSSSRVATEVVERAEVLKGPGALLNGISPGGSIGGGINVVTKRAGDTPLTRLTTSYRTDSQFGVHADVGRRFGENNEWGVRVNAAVRDGDTNLDDQNQKVSVGSLGLDYKGSKVRWSLDAIVQNEDLDGTVRPQVAFSGAIPLPPSSKANIFPGSSLYLQDATVATRLEIDLNDRLTAFAAIGKRRGSADQVFGQAARTGAATPQGNIRADYYYYDSYSDTVSAEIGLRGEFQTGPIKHNVVTSISRLDQESGYYSRVVIGVPSNIYNPSPAPQLTGERKGPTKSDESTLSSIAVADTMSMFDKRLLVTLGARNQRVNTDSFSLITGLRTTGYGDSAVTPMAAVLFRAADNISIYGNYIEGLTKGAIAGPLTANPGTVFPPYKSKQQEAGVKFDMGKFMSTVSVFQITKPSSYTDPVTNIFSFGGEQRNRGIELNAFGEVSRGIRVIAGAAFTDAKLTKTSGGVNQGKNAPAVPERTFNLGGEWDLPTVAGLTLNARAIYTGSVFYDQANRYTIPSWTRYDAGVRYVTRMGDKPVTIRANIENLTDKNFWILSGSYASVSAPRTLVVSASVDF